jgi:threonine dehydrogenase-like Zn-dependent dehydrogenase
MRAQKLVFTAPHELELQAFDFEAENLAPNEIAIRSHYTLISPGTELACFSGTEQWAKPPFTPGYAGCGEVIAVGSGVQGLGQGDLVFAYTPHASHVRAGAPMARLPEGLDTKLAPFARMAAVAITALRVGEAELGDTVAVWGLGLVGNLCAQLFTLAGCEVIGIDISPRRLALAQDCGVRHVVNGAEDVVAAVRDLTGGRMCSTVVEATGLPPVCARAADVAGKLGEVILLGSPRGEYPADLTAFLNRIHLWQYGCVTFKGAHEWRYPVSADPQGHAKHSLQRNIEILLGLIADDRLHVRQLLTHVLPPTEALAAYTGLRDKKDEYLGVLFDWGAGEK